MRRRVGECLPVTQTEPSPNASPLGSIPRPIVAITSPVAGSSRVSSPVDETLQSAPSPKRDAHACRAHGRLAHELASLGGEEDVRVGFGECLRALRSALRHDHDRRDGDSGERERDGAGQRPTPPRAPRRAREVERRILAEDRLLELAKRLARLDPELLDEPLARVAVDA